MVTWWRQSGTEHHCTLEPRLVLLFRYTLCPGFIRCLKDRTDCSMVAAGASALLQMFPCASNSSGYCKNEGVGGYPGWEGTPAPWIALAIGYSASYTNVYGTVNFSNFLTCVFTLCRCESVNEQTSISMHQLLFIVGLNLIVVHFI